MTSLYHASIKSVLESDFKKSLNEVHTITPNMKFDIIIHLYENKKNELLQDYVNKWFLLLISFGIRRMLLHKIFVRIEQEECVKGQMQDLLCRNILMELRDYVTNGSRYEDGSIAPDSLHTIATYNSVKRGLNCAIFLSDAGQYKNSSRILKCVEAFVYLSNVLIQEKVECKKGDPPSQALLTKSDRFEEFSVKILTNLLHNYTEECNAEECATYLTCLKQQLKSVKFREAAAFTQAATQISKYYFFKSHYKEALHHALQALKLLSNAHVSPKITIDALRQTGVVFLKSGQLRIAKELIEASIQFCKLEYGDEHFKYADCLMAIGDYHVETHMYEHASKDYKKALKVSTNDLVICA